jgi:proline iminopeptidase
MMPFRQDTGFFPPVTGPRASGHLDVGDGHRIWWEETGPAAGRPVLVLHGGPGGSIRPYYRRLLDPARHRGIFFDQRACGNSTFTDAFANNTTQALVADMERLREARGIERWTVVGGSWGSTLALAYAETHPERVTGLLVSGVYLARQWDIGWWWSGWGPILPDVLAARDALLTPAERADPRTAFRARIRNPDPAIHRPAAEALDIASLETLDLMPATLPQTANWLDERSLLSSRLHLHYDEHDFFLEPDQLLKNAGRLSAIPGAIIAGRNDLCTPPQGAWDLKTRWPAARLSIVAAAGHRWNDEALGRVLVPEIGRLAG